MTLLSEEREPRKDGVEDSVFLAYSCCPGDNGPLPREVGINGVAYYFFFQQENHSKQASFWWCSPASEGPCSRDAPGGQRYAWLEPASGPPNSRPARGSLGVLTCLPVLAFWGQGGRVATLVIQSWLPVPVSCSCLRATPTADSGVTCQRTVKGPF